MDLVTQNLQPRVGLAGMLDEVVFHSQRHSAPRGYCKWELALNELLNMGEVFIFTKRLYNPSIRLIFHLILHYYWV